MRLWSKHFVGRKNCQRRQGKGCSNQDAWHHRVGLMDRKLGSARRKSNSPDTIIDGSHDIAHFSVRRRNISAMFYLGCIVFLCMQRVHGFTQSMHAGIYEPPSITLQRRQALILHASKDGDGDEEEQDDSEEIESNQEELSVLHDLNWRVDQIRLEEAHTRRFLKSGPRFLPYNECRKWVIAFNRWGTEDEWKQWIDDGEKRNAYIPSSPDVYYGKRGEWKGWDHFLGVETNDDDESISFQ